MRTWYKAMGKCFGWKMPLVTVVTFLCYSVQEGIASEAVTPSPERRATDVSLAVLVEQDSNVVFHGVVSFDKAGGPGAQFLNPAPNLAGMVAAVLTHGIIVESSKSAQKKSSSKMPTACSLPISPLCPISGFAICSNAA